VKECHSVEPFEAAIWSGFAAVTHPLLLLLSAMGKTRALVATRDQAVGEQAEALLSQR